MGHPKVRSRTMSISDLAEPVESSVVQFFTYFQYICAVLIGLWYELTDMIRQVSDCGRGFLLEADLVGCRKRKRTRRKGMLRLLKGSIRFIVDDWQKEFGRC
mmetsp:Transcript_26382/g.42755  ORF Transcript_26382/g.42755 Transcript_26382/m.42755 type:complete len:102 (-) Transcript_26382:1290-1595(-)